MLVFVAHASHRRSNSLWKCYEMDNDTNVHEWYSHLTQPNKTNIISLVFFYTAWFSALFTCNSNDCAQTIWLQKCGMIRMVKLSNGLFVLRFLLFLSNYFHVFWGSQMHWAMFLLNCIQAKNAKMIPKSPSAFEGKWEYGVPTNSIYQIHSNI